MIFFVEMIRFIFESKVGQPDKSDMRRKLIFPYLNLFQNVQSSNAKHAKWS